MSLDPRTRRERRAYNKPPENLDALPRKRCANCPKFFRMNKGGNKRFCSPECKQEWHDNGGNAFGPLKARLEKLVGQWTRQDREAVEARFKKLERALYEIAETLDQMKG